MLKDTQTGQFKAKDWTGHRSGRLTVLEPTGEADKYGYKIWRAQCDCGTVIEKSVQAFGRNHPLQSCGCGPKGRKRELDALAGLYRKHKLNVRHRREGLTFDLSEELFRELVTSPCFYCGAEPRERRHPYLNGTVVANGIDRVDSSLGYLVGNVVSCCTICNRAKNDMPQADFIQWLKRVADYHMSAHFSLSRGSRRGAAPTRPAIHPESNIV